MIDQKPVSVIGKGLYGALIMVKTIVDDVCFGSMTTFKRTKVHFVHATDKAYILQFLFSLYYFQDIYLWNMYFKPLCSMFDILT
ncbi:hypothetical protein BCV72DRAFT_49309 [Rhizopus microsporus var. microsporus]|uniref:Uncharacterized protein n=2 Tax=Rhizopus microsporus TaxID=58291 RepID=A0A2G4T2T2_RHIZD|nr:uncharacterized protein RHIMIDRAFT_87299 [Rhizopus microsporus ATCC 52813]ORE02448.1 hypothetical protein BCV72DRAFT_49309 [Rhizopus microsporus var. microsporus]PHZ15318.1 hypothetical protein RHIMIDRAFT_87299 [Rhizopus microsporus ATCC 52813]